MTLDESASDGIMLNNAMPIADFDGMNTTSYKFTLKNTGDMDSNYELKLTDQAITGTRMPDRVVKYWFVKDGEETGPALLNTVSDRIFDRGILKSGASVSYELKVWIDYNAGNEIQGTQFNTKITVDGSQIVPTDENCFTFDESTNTITGYLCYEGNPYDKEVVTDLIIPNTINGIDVKAIGNSAFEMYMLYSVYIYDGITTIGQNAFSSNDLRTVVMADSITSMGAYAFSNNYSLHTVDLSNNLTVIPAEAFSFCGLDHILIPDSVKRIENAAFADNYSSSIILSNRLEYIGESAFSGAEVVSITIPASVKEIGNSAFGSAVSSIGHKLTSVIIQGKSSSADFQTYGSNIWSWASGYSDANIIWEP